MTWANLAEELPEEKIRECAPKAVDHSKGVTEKFYLSKRHVEAARFTKAMTKHPFKNMMSGESDISMEEGEEEVSPQNNESIANVEAEGDSSSEEDAESSEIVGKTTSLALTKGLTKAQKELIIKQLCPGLAKRQRNGELEVNEACKRSVDFKKLYDALKLRVFQSKIIQTPTCKFYIVW